MTEQQQKLLEMPTRKTLVNEAKTYLKSLQTATTIYHQFMEESNNIPDSELLTEITDVQNQLQQIVEMENTVHYSGYYNRIEQKINNVDGAFTLAHLAIMLIIFLVMTTDSFQTNELTRTFTGIAAGLLIANAFFAAFNFSYKKTKLEKRKETASPEQMRDYKQVTKRFKHLKKTIDSSLLGTPMNETYHTLDELALALQHQPLQNKD